MFRPMTRRFGWLIALTFVVIIVTALLFALTKMVYRINANQVGIMLKLDNLVKDKAAKDVEVRTALDDIYRTLYAAPAENPKSADTRRPSAVELWQRNRDQELRNRILRLERWRYEMEH